MAIEVQVPTLGESVTSAVLLSWHRKDGERVNTGDPLCELETDKANVDLPAPAAGVLQRGAAEGQTVKVGEVIAQIDPAGVAAATPAKPAPAAQGAPAPAPATQAPPAPSASPTPPGPSGDDGAARLEQSGPAARRMVGEHKLDPNLIPGTGKGGRITKEDVIGHLESHRGESRPAGPMEPAGPREARPAAGAGAGGAGSAGAAITAGAGPTTLRAEPAPVPAPMPRPAVQPAPQEEFDEYGERRVPMSRIRRRIAENLVRAQSTAAILTTFNEVDLSAVMELRSRWKEQFEKMHGVGLGFMSFFARAVVLALGEYPSVNAFIDGDDILYHEHVNLGIAVSTERGLAVPVLKQAQAMSFARIESEIKRLAAATRDGKLSLEELSGGTFTITNGGVFGSLLSTPILNPPQSGILGMHTIQRRPVAIGEKIEIRPMMYVALSYDHRIVDGREAIGCLVRIKQLLEDPARMMLGV